MEDRIKRDDIEVYIHQKERETRNRGDLVFGGPCRTKAMYAIYNLQKWPEEMTRIEFLKLRNNGRKTLYYLESIGCTFLEDGNKPIKTSPIAAPIDTDMRVKALELAIKDMELTKLHPDCLLARADEFYKWLTNAEI